MSHLLHTGPTSAMVALIEIRGDIIRAPTPMPNGKRRVVVSPVGIDLYFESPEVLEAAEAKMADALSLTLPTDETLAFLYEQLAQQGAPPQ